MLDTSRLIRIGKAKKREQAAWLEGVALERDACQSIQELRLRVVSARFRLALEMRRQCDTRLRESSAAYRLTISRSYYAMYHAMRAAAYIFHGGDDHELHSELPTKVPSDFPNSALWGNQLKSAREYRNQADYDPYPRGIAYWRGVAHGVSGDAGRLIPAVRGYLKGRGCKV